MFCKNNKNWQKNGKLKNEREKTANRIRITKVRIMFSFVLIFFSFRVLFGDGHNNFFRELRWIFIFEKYFTRCRLVHSFCSQIGGWVRQHAQGPFACWSHYGNNVFCSRTLRWLWLLGIERLSFTHQFVNLPIPMNFICAAQWNSFVVSLVGNDECVCAVSDRRLLKNPICSQMKEKLTFARMKYKEPDYKVFLFLNSTKNELENNRTERNEYTQN